MVWPSWGLGYADCWSQACLLLIHCWPFDLVRHDEVVVEGTLHLPGLRGLTRAGVAFSGQGVTLEGGRDVGDHRPAPAALEKQVKMDLIRFPTNPD